MTKTVWTAVLLVTKAEWANSLGLAGNQSVNLTRPGKELLFAPMSDQARQDRSNEPARTGLSTGTHNMAYLFRSFPVPLAYTKTSNAAISGHNLLHLKEKTATECALECSVTTWCKTFDYYKNHNWTMPATRMTTTQGTISTLTRMIAFKSVVHEHQVA